MNNRTRTLRIAPISLALLAPLSGASHTLRGGGWLSTPNQSRAAARDWASALEAGPNA